MKRTVILTFVIALLATRLLAQNEIQQGCDFLDHIHFKNGTDTIMVLGYKNANIRFNENDPNLNKLYSQKKINKNITYAIEIQPANCEERFFVFCTDTSKFADGLYRDVYNKPVLIRCVVFEGYIERSHPLFIVDKIIAKE